MTLREVRKIANEVNRTGAKVVRLLGETAKLREEAFAKLNILAKENCPYKKGQIFKKRGASVWALLKSIDPVRTLNTVSLGIREEELRAPYTLSCHRCTVKGVGQKDNWVIFGGEKIGVEWDPVEDA
jgi:hypothetical protein